MKPFDPTKPYCRRDGKPAKIVHTFLEIKRYLIVTTDSYGIEFSYEAYLNGKYAHVGRGKEESVDLVNIPEKIEGWQNVYKRSVGYYVTQMIYPTQSEALIKADPDVIACIKVFFTEGEGLND